MEARRADTNEDDLLFRIIMAPFLIFSFIGTGILFLIGAALFPLLSLIKRLYKTKLHPVHALRHYQIGGRN